MRAQQPLVTAFGGGDDESELPDQRSRFLAPRARRLGARLADYARRTVERLLGHPGPRRDLDGRPLADLAAMSGEFAAAARGAVVSAIARFFGERPPRVEVEGTEYAVGPTPGALTPQPG